MLDAASVVAQRRGDAFMNTFGAAMTGVVPKTTFLKPGVALPLALEIPRQLLRGKRGIDARYAQSPEAGRDRATSFRNACLIDAGIGG
jgi:hypothetical protein